MAKKVTFILSADIVANATDGLLLGEFNNWNKDNGFSLIKKEDGSLQTSVLLEEGKTYQYRYLLNDGRWVNDESAQGFIADGTFHVENCVITVPVAQKPTKEKKVAVETVAAKAEEVAVVKEDAPTKKVKKSTAKKTVITKADDLTKIEGVGKKIAEILFAANIASFTDLSKTTAKELKAILEAAGNKFKVHDPATWPKQAKLAAAEKWDDLTALQKELKGGK